MKKLNFSIRFFDYNFQNDQSEYIVHCSQHGCDQSKQLIKTFKIMGSDNCAKFSMNEASNIFADICQRVEGIANQPCNKKLENAFWLAVKEGLEEQHPGGFDFELSQNILENEDFQLLSIKAVTTKYTKTVNGEIFKKPFSEDIRTAVSVAKLEYYKNLTNPSELPKQLNVSRIQDEEESKTLFYAEFIDDQSQWFDGTTWLSDDEVRPFFSSSVTTFLEACASLQEQIDANFLNEWDEIYSSNGEYFQSRAEMEEKQNF